MGFLRDLKSIYSLEVLDTRFGASSRNTAHVARIDPAQPSGVKNAENTLKPARAEAATARPPPRSLWNTPEFYVYYLVFIVVVPLMFKAVIEVSQPSHPNYGDFAHLLSPGWIAGRKVDNSDLQYASFRNNIPYMLLVLMLQPLLRSFYNQAYSASTTPASSISKDGKQSEFLADGRLRQRLTFDLYFGLAFIFALHGLSAFKVLAILYFNYQMVTTLPRSITPYTTWIFGLTVLFANELLHGYPYEWLFSFINVFSAQAKPNLGSVLDGFGGLVPRWEVLFKFALLRFISFNFDYLWCQDRQEQSPNEKQLDMTDLTEKERVASGALPQDFDLFNYFAYTLYSPLFLAGPILTFNDYIAQSRTPSKSISTERTIVYGIRFGICLLVMEFVLHYVYAVAISKAQPVWEVYSPFQLSMLGYFNLHIIWLKLLLPWRFFRFWALVDGIDAPENMVRCMSDNYSTLQFWRSWHRSYNRWVVRYLFIPLGGSRVSQQDNKFLGWARAIVNYIVVFMFVAVWHDLNLRVLLWGWLIVFFIVPEAIATLLFPASKWRRNPTQYRILCAIGAIFNILMMMAANLVGFALGLDGLQGLLTGIISTFQGQVFFLSACACLFVGTQVMFEVRASELRRGIKMGC